MAYTSPVEIKKIVTNLPANFPEERLQFYADKATAYLNGLLGGVYAVPFTEPVPPLIAYLANDIAVYFLKEDLYSGQKPNAVEDMVDRWERITKMIADILSGALYIGVDPIKKDGSGFATTNLVDNIFSLEDPYW